MKYAGPVPGASHKRGKGATKKGFFEPPGPSQEGHFGPALLSKMTEQWLHEGLEAAQSPHSRNSYKKSLLYPTGLRRRPEFHHKGAEKAVSEKFLSSLMRRQ
jgi:hypothetical protein